MSPSEQIDLTSGLHRYFGDASELRFKIVISNSELRERRPEISKAASRTNPSSQRQSSQLSDHKQNEAQFILSRKQNNTGWSIDPDIDNDHCRVHKTTRSADPDDLAAVLQQNGIKLRVVSAPTSRIVCNNCEHMTADVDNLATATSAEGNQSICLAASKLLENDNQRLLMFSDSEKRLSDDKELFPNKPGAIGALIERKRASTWKATSSMTSETHYWQQTRARSLQTRIVSTTQQDSRMPKIATMTTTKHVNRALMRNHYWPLYEPCSCSRSSVRGGTSNTSTSAKAAKSDINVSDPTVDCCCPRSTLLLSCVSCRTHINCNHNGHLDHLKIYTSLANVSGSNATCNCYCSELSELYKRRQKNSSNICANGGARGDNFGASLPGTTSFASSSSERFGFGPNDARTNRTIDDSENNTGEMCKQNARANSASSAGLNLDDKSAQMSGKSNGKQQQQPSQGSEATKLQTESQSSATDAVARKTGHKPPASSLLQQALNNASSFSELADNSTGCQCKSSHGETLFILMEKYPSCRKTSAMHADLRLEESGKDSSADKDKSRPEPSVFALKIDNAAEDAEAERSIQRSKHEVCDSLILLATIVIDVFNERLQLKPDLNQTIMIDLGNFLVLDTFGAQVGGLATKTQEQSTNASSAAAAAATTASASTSLINCNQIQSAHANAKLLPSKLLYSIEFVPVELNMEKFEETVSVARAEFGLTPNNRETLTSPLSAQGLNSRIQLSSMQFATKHDSTGSLGSRGLIIRLQFDICFASGFAFDCRNLYVKYKILARWPKKRWILRRRQREFNSQERTNDLVDASRDRQSKLLSDLNYRGGSYDERVKDEDEKKLNEKQISEQIQRQHESKWSMPLLHVEDPGQFNCSNGVAFSLDDDKPLEVGKTTDRKTIVANRERDGDIVGEYLLAGSTITSRPNSLGHFNFSCIEQLVLELQPRGNRATTSIGECNGDKIAHSLRPMRTKPHNKSRVLSSFEDSSDSSTSNTHMVTNDRFQSHQLNKERPIVPTKTPGEIIELNMQVNRDEQQDCGPNPAAKQLQINDSFSSEQLVEGGYNRHDLSELNSDRFDKNLVHEVDDKTGGGGGTSNSEDCVKQLTNNSCEQRDLADDLAGYGGRQNDSIAAAKTTLSPSRDLNRYNGVDSRRHPLLGGASSYNGTAYCNDSDTICDLTLLLEVYSSDFYSDKFQGWSSLNIPVSLDQNSSGRRTRKSSNPSCNGHLIKTSPSSASSENENHCTKIKLPVLRPALCNTLDRLRYYLTGRMPNWTPSIESVSKGHA